LELLWWFPVLHGAASCLISSQCWVQLITYSTSFFFFPWHCGFLVSSYSLATFVCLLFTHSSLISTGSQHYFSGFSAKNLWPQANYEETDQSKLRDILKCIWPVLCKNKNSFL
jgi:hypothetical protein